MPNERLDRLEERVAWMERHLTEQDKAMLDLHGENRRLQRALAELRAGFVSLEGDASPPAATEKPPHH
jgi:SlyX protein